MRMPIMFPFVLSIVHAYAYYQFCVGLITSQELLILYLVSLLSVFFWCFWSFRKQQDQRLAVLLLVTYPILGGVGAWGCLCTSLAFALFSHTTKNFEHWHREMLSMEQESLLARRCIKHARESLKYGDFRVRGITSFYDVLRVGSEQEKRKALTLMARGKLQAFGDLLKEYSNDQELTVKVLASTLLGKMQESAHGQGDS